MDERLVREFTEFQRVSICRSSASSAGMWRSLAYDFMDGGELAEAATASDLNIETVRRAFQPQQMLDRLFDAACGTVAPGSTPWLVAEHALINGLVTTRAAEWLAACSTERALVSALVAARHLDRYTWEGSLDMSAALAANVWDCFPSQEFPRQEQPA